MNKTGSQPSRRHFLAALAGAPFLRAAAAGNRPNLVFLLADDQRWDTLGCMGNPIIKTPNADQMAGDGVIFNNHFVTTSICMTSRASFFSGLYARCHAINSFSQSFSEEQYRDIYPVRLREAGYRTGFVGKWGVGKEMPDDRFDYFAGFPGQGHYFPNRPDKSVHLTEVMGDQSMEFLNGCSPDKPFCLSVSFKAPHVQDEDPQQFLHSLKTSSLYKDVDIPVPPTADDRYIRMLPKEIQRSESRRRWAVRFGTPELYQESVKSYYRLITEVDTVVGRVREQLKKMGADDNTVIVYSGDNGFYLAEHGLAGKWYMHEESIRTPLIVYDPRLPKSSRGSRRDEMCLNIDVAPTLLSLAGIDRPEVQGRDLSPLLQGRSVPWRTEWFYEHMFEHAWIPRTEGWRDNRWKYVRYLDTEPRFEEMFDLDADPKEMRNLADDESRRARLGRLRGRCDTWVSALDAWRPGRRWKDPA